MDFAKSKNLKIHYGGVEQPIIMNWKELLHYSIPNLLEAVEKPKGTKQFYIVQTPEKVPKHFLIVSKKEKVHGPFTFTEICKTYENIYCSIRGLNFAKEIVVSMPQMANFAKLNQVHVNFIKLSELYNLYMCNDVASHIASIFPQAYIKVGMYGGSYIIVRANGVCATLQGNTILGDDLACGIMTMINSFCSYKHCDWFQKADKESKLSQAPF